MRHRAKLSNILALCYYHDMYAFQSKSTLYSCLNVKELLARNRHDIWSLSDSNRIWTHKHLVRKWTLNHWAVLWVLIICAMQLTVCFYHVTYAFQSESTLYSCLNVKELLAQNRRNIWSLSDIWNPGKCDFECNEACRTDEYLDIKNCLISKLFIMSRTHFRVNLHTVKCTVQISSHNTAQSFGQFG